MESTSAERIYDRLMVHLSDLNTSQTPDVRLFDEAALVLPNALRGTAEMQSQRLALVSALASSLTTAAFDPTPVVQLLVKLFDDFTWAQVCSFSQAQAVPFQTGLEPSEAMVPYNRLMLTLLAKASRNSTDAAHVASMLNPDPVVRCLVKCWLQTPDAGIAAEAQQLLVDLLTVDREEVRDVDSGELPAGGQGLVWRRIFGDRDVYNVFFESCSSRSGNGHSKAERTLAQARLLEWLPEIGRLDWQTVARSHHEDIEAQYGVDGGLLDFASLIMVDYQDDVLMHRCLIDYYSALLVASKPSSTIAPIPDDSPGLQYLITRGLHIRTAAIYFQLPGSQHDPLDAMFLYGPAADYVAIYAQTYPEHFLKSQMPAQVIDRLRAVLSSRQLESPKHDLHVMASLPRQALLGDESNSLLALLSSQTGNPDVIKTLASIFHGPSRTIVEFPASSPMMGAASEREIEEATCARALYYHYLNANPRFWADMTTRADTVALKDVALAALSCLHAVITANWSNKTDLYPIPSSLNPVTDGFLAVISPPAGQTVVPYLASPARVFSNLIGGRDVESAAYKIAAAKFDCLQAMHDRLVTLSESQRTSNVIYVLGQVSHRLAQGPMSREGEIGGRIGTLEL